MGLPEFLLGTLSFGDVADRAHYQGAFLGLEGAQTDLDRKLGAIPAQAVEFRAGAHWTHLWMGQEAAAVIEVLLAIAFRDQHHDCGAAPAKSR